MRTTDRLRNAAGAIGLMMALLAAAACHAESLQEQLDTMAAGFAERVPAELRATFAEGIDEVRRSGLVAAAKNRGDAAPDGELIASDGAPTRLASAWAEGPAVVTFYRGGWCPYCNLTLKALEESLAEIEGAGATLVAITPEIAAKAADTTANNGLSFTVLSDPGNMVAKQFGVVFPLPDVILPFYRDRLNIAEYNGDEDYELPLAATYVIDRHGVIRWAFLDADYKKRAEPAEIVAAVRAIAE